LCVPNDSIHKLLGKEVHGGGLTRHFGINKTINILEEQFYWPNMGWDIHDVISKYVTYHHAKSQLLKAFIILF